jgi:hypothetical protein
MIDDFESGDAEIIGDGRTSYWVSYGDESAGTIVPSPSVSWLPDVPGRADSGYALHTSGGDFTVWGSGNAFDFSWNDDGGCIYDASIYDGITFWARGEVTTVDSSSLDSKDVDSIKVQLMELDILPTAEGGRCDGEHGQCYDSHRTRIQVGSCWQRYSIAFADLAQDGWGQSGGELNLDQLVGLAFEVPKYTDFDFWIDDLAFYAGDKPSYEEDCAVSAPSPDGQAGASPL